MASTASRNSSREPVWATACRTHGITRRPTTSMIATNSATLASVSANTPPRPSPILAARPSAGGAVPLIMLASAGSSTSVSTMARSSTISQPTAMRPRSVSTNRRSLSARSNTTVLATDSARPNTMPPASDQPRMADSPTPSRVAAEIWATAPGMAMAPTLSRSLSEKCRPTPNISRMTPISANSGARVWSATKPGVNGPTTIPASR